MILTLVATVAISASCEWDSPRGLYAVTDVAPSSLVDNYKDIPPATRAKLKKRMDALQYDEFAEIRKDSIRGAYKYSNLRDMHFGASGQKMCRSVGMSKWEPAEWEAGLVYCEDGHCLISPIVCRNVSRLTRGERIAPPPSMAPERTAVEVEPLTVAADVPLPTVDSGPVAVPYEPQTFARLSSPESLSEPQQPQDAYPDRITADQSWGEMSQWRPVFGARFSRELPAPSGSVPAPVPGIFPPNDVSVPVAPVPEPGTWGLFLMGLAFVWWAVRRVRVQKDRRG